MSKTNPFGVINQHASKRPKGMSLKEHIDMLAYNLGLQAKAINAPFMSDADFDELLNSLGKSDLNDMQWSIVRKAFARGRFR